MPTKRQIAGMRGVYAVAAELSRLGLLVELAPFARGAVDMRVTLPETEASYTVKVHGIRSPARFWIVRNLIVSPDHIYVFVRFREDQNDYYVVPSIVVDGRRRHTTGTWPRIKLAEIENYKDFWELPFGLPINP